jgi:large subunit ribosomal protein L13
MKDIYTIDAKGKKIGRVASEVAKILMGKNKVSYAKNRAPEVAVTITNASKLSISEKKRTAKKYVRFSGYAGGIKFEALENLAERKGYGEALRHAVKGMLPGNKLRPRMMKRLTIEE